MKLRVATLNVWALPLGIAPRLEARMRALAERLASDEADVWALQEVWTPDARRTLESAARAAGLHVATSGTSRTGNGGLLVASRLPFDGPPRFQPYTCAGVAAHIHRGDWLGGKGFLRVRLSTVSGPLVLYDTHLHAQYHPDGEDPYYAHRMGQIVELSAALRAESEPLVAVGDFNAREGTPAYAVLQALTGLRDAAAELDRREPTSSSGTRIDYVFTRGPAPRAIRIFAERMLYADHAGVLAEIELTGEAPPPPPAPDAEALAVARAALEQGLTEAHARRWGDRALALAAGGTAAAALSARLTTRRAFLRGSLLAAGAVALPAAGLQGVASERWDAGEVAGFEGMLAVASSFSVQS